ncbi:MAG TPA: hypothetical protein VHC95_05185 [Opitutales bacterium]|nr:hypothetical protein [Opitutales bacterium]
MFEDEHSGHGVPETLPEMGYRLHWLGLVVLGVVGGGGLAGWSLGTMAVMSLVGFALLIANRETFAGSMKALWWRLAGWLLPVWVALGAFFIGLAFPAFRVVTVGSTRYWELAPHPGTWAPLDAPIKIGGLDVLLSVGLFSATLSAMLLCKSRLVFARAWATLAFCAGVGALLGIVESVTQASAVLWAIPIGNPLFFSTFAHPAQWCAFALLWMSACLGVIAWLARQRGWRLLTGEGWALLLTLGLLGASIMLAGDPLHRMLALLVAAIGCLVIAWQSRIERLRAKHSSLGVSVLGWALIGLLLFACAALLAVRHPVAEWINYGGAGLALHERVIEDTQTLWRERPWFGWGAGTFRIAYSFVQGADQTPLFFAYARSDLWQSLAEHGLIGTLAWCVPAGWVLARLIWQRRLATFLIAPLAGLGAIALLTIVDFPLASPVVFFSFWLMLLSLGRWSEVDKENTTSAPSEKRRVEKLRAEGKTLPPKPAATA